MFLAIPLSASIAPVGGRSQAAVLQGLQGVRDSGVPIRGLFFFFNGRHKSGRLDLEAIDMAVRAAMHQAGAAALTELLQFPAPAAEQRTIFCSCARAGYFRRRLLHETERTWNEPKNAGVFRGATMALLVT